MQKQYLSIGNDQVFNGQYLLAIYYIDTYNDIDLEDATTEVAAESSTGSNLKIAISTNFSESLNALVYKIDKENKLVWIAYPWRIFDRGGNLQNIITFIAGNIYGMGELKACKLLDIQIPPSMLSQYDGPNYTIDDMRNYLKIFDRPILGTIIKPKIGYTPSEYAEECYDFWVGGGDFVKNDEPQSDQDFCPFDNMVHAVREAMDKAEDETGQTKVHSFNVSAADLDTMIIRADIVRKVMKRGSYAYLVDGITAGWTALQTIRRHYPEVFLHFHRAAHGAFTRKENPFGFTVPVLTKFARLAGASGVHTGTAGIGKMSGDKEDDIISAHLALRLKAQGLYFEQIWAEIPHQDRDLNDSITEEENSWKLNPRELAKKRREVGIAKDDNLWRAMKKTVPIISGGLNPVLLPQFIDAIGTIDFITTMGGGVHSHPEGTQKGAKAIIQAYNAWFNNVTLEEYAKDHEELRTAIDFFNKNGTQAHRLPVQ